MLARMGDELTVCLLHLEECERKAADPAFSRAARADFARVAESWRRLAASLEVATRISSYLEWRAKRLEPPPDWRG